MACADEFLTRLTFVDKFDIKNKDYRHAVDWKCSVHKTKGRAWKRKDVKHQVYCSDCMWEDKSVKTTAQQLAKGRKTLLDRLDYLSDCVELVNMTTVRGPLTLKCLSNSSHGNNGIVTLPDACYVYENKFGCPECGLEDRNRQTQQRCWAKAGIPTGNYWKTKEEVLSELPRGWTLIGKYKGSKTTVFSCPNKHKVITHPSRLLKSTYCEQCKIEEEIATLPKDWKHVGKFNGFMGMTKFKCPKGHIVEYNFNKMIIYPCCGHCSRACCSQIAISWLESVEESLGYRIQHAGHGKEYRPPENLRLAVDGYDENTNTVYEFHGGFFHGDPLEYKANDIVGLSGNSALTRYLKTRLKENALKSWGYNLVSMWESDYKIGIIRERSLNSFMPKIYR